MKEDIKDTEIRIIGEMPTLPPRRIRKMPWKWVVPACVLLLGLMALTWWLKMPTADDTTDIPSAFEQTEVVQPHPLADWLQDSARQSQQGVDVRTIRINDIDMTIYLPVGLTPRLELGYSCLSDTNRLHLMFQAADVRADNKKIVGAFVLKGKPLSWGLSKRGWCAIIDTHLQVGVADNSPLFEQATETGGYFFRQYPLVDNSRLVENELKTKSVRRALAEVEGCIVVVETATPESLHDFAQALVDMGTKEAIYLVGSSAIGWYRDLEGKGHASGQWQPRAYKNANFIVWE